MRHLKRLNNRKFDKTDWLVLNIPMNENHRKKKQPQVVRALLLDAAAHIATEIGIGNLTLDLVAQRAGVSKGGLIHHFSNRAALIEGLFNQILLAFEKSIEEIIASDENKSGRFARAYLKATTNTCEDTHENKLLGVFTLAMSTDGVLSAKWRDWLQGQIEKHGGENSALCSVIRYAADGIWLEFCSGAAIIDSTGRKSVIEYLLELTYKI
jgi:AcrR family transcriptional regulator